MAAYIDFFAEFKSEAELREEFVSPLLSRLGFQNVALTHGSLEFGKDLIFSDAHILAGRHFHAVQVKHQAKVTQGDVPNLTRQIEEAFDSPFQIPGTQREGHISWVHVINSGVFTDNARTAIANKLRTGKYPDNVSLIDGYRLRELATIVLYDQNLPQLRRLVGLQKQTQMNVRIWTRIYNAPVTKMLEIQGSLLSGLEEFIGNPVPMFVNDARFYPHVERLWEYAKIIDRLCAGLLNPCVDEKWIATHTLTLRDTTRAAIYQAQDVLYALGNEIANLRPFDPRAGERPTRADRTIIKEQGPPPRIDE